jgi:hypothetical protein
MQLLRVVQAEEAYTQQLEQQLAAVRMASDALHSTTKQQAEAQGPMHFGLSAMAGERRSMLPVSTVRAGGLGRRLVHINDPSTTAV